VVDCLVASVQNWVYNQEEIFDGTQGMDETFGATQGNQEDNVGATQGTEEDNVVAIDIYASRIKLISD